MPSDTTFLSRTALLLGEESIALLRRAHVLVVGVGGVGGMALAMLARAGVGRFTIVDGDCVAESNINRQQIAWRSTLGESKCSAARKMLHEISPEIIVESYDRFITEADIPTLLARASYSFVADAIDTIGPKCALLAACHEKDIPVISSMGAGAKVDPGQIQLADLSKTHTCALAKAVRRRLASYGIKRGIPTVFSSEPALAAAILSGSCEQGKQSTVGTVSYMPNIFGCFMAAHIIRQLSHHE